MKWHDLCLIFGVILLATLMFQCFGCCANDKITFRQILNVDLTKVSTRYQSNKVVFLFIIDFETLPEYYQYSHDIISAYCKLHNYELLIKNHHNDTHKINHYWWRVHDLIKLCDQYDPDTIFIHIDIDACVNPKYFDISIDELLTRIDCIAGKQHDLFVSMDMPEVKFFRKRYADIMCAGVFIIRNTQWSKNILQYWWSKYNPNNWTLTNGKWVCMENNKICEYARDNYDQGELNNLYNNNILDAKKHILQLDYSVLSDRGDFGNANFIYHLMALSDEERKHGLKAIYDTM